jgi:hypothetical protein
LEKTCSALRILLLALLATALLLQRAPLAADPLAGLPSPDSVRMSGQTRPLLASVLSVHAAQLQQPLPNLTGYRYDPDGLQFAVSPQTDVMWGQELTIRLAIANYGGAAVPMGAEFHIRFYLSPDDDIGPGDYVWFDSSWAGGLEEETYLDVEPIRVRLPTTAPAILSGSNPIYVGMFIDWDNRILESDETDNRNVGRYWDWDLFEPVDQVDQRPAIWLPVIIG